MSKPIKNKAIENNKTNKLTRRERLLFKNLADNPGISIREAARKAGYAESTVKSTIYTQIQAKTSLNAGMKQIMDAQGLTDERLVEKISEGLEAMRVFTQKESLIETTIPDYGLRAKYLELAAKLKGLLEKNLHIAAAQTKEESFYELLERLKNEPAYEKEKVSFTVSEEVLEQIALEGITID